MAADGQDLPALVKEIRRQLALNQEDLARELGVSFATIVSVNLTLSSQKLGAVP